MDHEIACLLIDDERDGLQEDERSTMDKGDQEQRKMPTGERDARELQRERVQISVVATRMQ